MAVIFMVDDFPNENGGTTAPFVGSVQFVSPENIKAYWKEWTDTVNSMSGELVIERLDQILDTGITESFLRFIVRKGHTVIPRKYIPEDAVLRIEAYPDAPDAARLYLGDAWRLRGYSKNQCP